MAAPGGDTSDASEMLAAALEQMDDIIAGTKLQSAELQNGLMESEQSHYTSSPGYSDPTMIPKLAEDLRIAAERAEEQGDGRIYTDQVPQWTKDFLSQWLQSNGAMNDDSYQLPHERVQRLESEKHSLHLQVNVLSEQVEIQTEKIHELEYALNDSERKLFDTETRLQEERRMRRPSYGDAKRNDSNEIPQLQLRLNAAENEVALLRERTMQAESRLEEREQDLYLLEEKYEGTQRALKEVQEESRNWQEKYMESQSEIEHMHTSGPTRQQFNADRERFTQVIENLQTSNNEKERMIDELKRNLRKYKRVEEIFITAQGPKADLVQRLEEELARTDTGSTSSSVTVESESSSRMGGGREDGPMEYSSNSLPRDLSSKHRSASMENLKPVDGLLETDIDVYPSGYRTLPSPRSKTSEPNSPVRSRNGDLRKGSFEKDTLQKGRKTSSSEPNLEDDKKEPASKDDKKEPASTITETDEGFMEVHRRRQVTFDPQTNGIHEGHVTSDGRTKKGGIKKLIGKLRRSNSASLQDEDYDSPIEFQRGSRYRATAMPRLGWSPGVSHGRMGRLQILSNDPKSNPVPPSSTRAERCQSMLNIDEIAMWYMNPHYLYDSNTDAPFSQWDVDQVAGWMHEMGLGRYVAMCRVWIKNGATLLQASALDLERNLGVRNPLHRKKLQLALQAVGSEQEDDAGQLDFNWVTRWLDDIGLPQYKDTFSEARIDGRMLHYLTVDDLLILKVTSALHHSSIMRGIQCLRLNKFHPHCLRRRPTDEPYENGTEVMLWTNHRVMDWLRSVDLSEYAPNLRGSGVHGALMTLENKFTAETLATLLSIPASKTLLRRHLGTHFMSLCGHEIQQAKRLAEKNMGFMPLNVIGKIKPKKRAFGARKRRGVDDEDYLCPMDEPLPVPLTAMKPSAAANNNTQKQPPTAGGSYKVEVRSADRIHKQADEILLDGPEMEENAASEIGAFSAELNTLTSKLEDDVHLNRSTHV